MGLEGDKQRKTYLKNKLKFIFSTIGDVDAANILAAYNGLKENKLKMDGVGYENDIGNKLKIRLMRRLTNGAFNLQLMALRAIKGFLKKERDTDKDIRDKMVKDRWNKDRCLRRLLFSNLRLVGLGFNKA